MKNPIWFIFWLIILWFVSFFVAGISAFLYIIIYIFVVCFPGLSVSICENVKHKIFELGLFVNNASFIHFILRIKQKNKIYRENFKIVWVLFVCIFKNANKIRMKVINLLKIKANYNKNYIYYLNFVSTHHKTLKSYLNSLRMTTLFVGNIYKWRYFALSHCKTFLKIINMTNYIK